MYTTASPYPQQITQQPCILQPVRTLNSTHNSHVHYSQSINSTEHTTAMYTTASPYPQQYTQQPVHTLNRTHDSHVHYSQSIFSTAHRTAMYTRASPCYWQYAVQQSTLQLVCTLKSTKDSNVHYSQRAPAVQNLEHTVCNKCPWNDVAIPTPIPTISTTRLRNIPDGSSVQKPVIWSTTGISLDMEGFNLLSTIDNKQQVIKELTSFRST